MITVINLTDTLHIIWIFNLQRQFACLVSQCEVHGSLHFDCMNLTAVRISCITLAIILRAATRLELQYG